MGWSAVETFWRKHMIRLQYLIGPTLLVFLVLQGIVFDGGLVGSFKGTCSEPRFRNYYRISASSKIEDNMDEPSILSIPHKHACTSLSTWQTTERGLNALMDVSTT